MADQLLQNRLNQLTGSDCLYHVNQHDACYAMFEWLLGTYSRYLASSAANQVEADTWLASECLKKRITITRATSTLAQIIKLATNCDAKMASAVGTVIAILVNNQVDEHNCVDWIKQHGGVQSIRLSFNRDGTLKNKVAKSETMNLERVSAFVVANVNGPMSCAELSIWLCQHAHTITSLVK